MAIPNLTGLPHARHNLTETVSAGDVYVAIDMLADGSAAWVHSSSKNLALHARYDREELRRLYESIGCMLKATAPSVAEAVERERSDA